MDPISDMFCQISNALQTKKSELTTPYSNFKKSILEVLKKEDCIENYEVIKKLERKTLKIKLQYPTEGRIVEKIYRISKPGLRIYKEAKHIPRSMEGFNLVLLSTNFGVLTGEQARRKKVGGEIICEIYY